MISGAERKLSDMKKTVFLFAALVCALMLPAQRNTLVKALNNYVAYANANNTALSNSLTRFERYNGLFGDYLRKDRKLGGEAYEKPRPSAFVDEDVFTMNEDNPDHLYAVAVKGSAALPVAVKTALNASAKSMHDCSRKIVLLTDSMSDVFSGPMISVTRNQDALPYRLLYEISRQLELSKKHRDQLLTDIETYYRKSCVLAAPQADYIHSVDSLKRGVEICQRLMDDLRSNDSTRIGQHVQALDSLCEYLERSEPVALKGIKPIGKSRLFPDVPNHNGFDLYEKHENIVEQLRLFSGIGKSFKKGNAQAKYPSGKCFYYHAECTSRFNSMTGLLYYYNEYVLLIGGGKMKINIIDLSGKSRYVPKGWSDGTRVLPVRTQLSAMKETPRFAVVFY